MVMFLLSIQYTPSKDPSHRISLLATNMSGLVEAILHKWFLHLFHIRYQWYGYKYIIIYIYICDVLWESKTKQVVAGLHWLDDPWSKDSPSCTMGQPPWVYLEPRWPLSSEVQFLQTRTFPTKTRVIWVLGIYFSIAVTNTIRPVLPCTFYFGTPPMNNLRKNDPWIFREFLVHLANKHTNTFWTEHLASSFHNTTIVKNIDA